MSEHNNSGAPAGLRGWWASPPRAGLQRMLSPWTFRHLRGIARVHLAAGVVLAGLGAVTLAGGLLTTKAAGFAALFLTVAAVHFALAAWELAVARSAPART